MSRRTRAIVLSGVVVASGATAAFVAVGTSSGAAGASAASASTAVQGVQASYLAKGGKHGRGSNNGATSTNPISGTESLSDTESMSGTEHEGRGGFGGGYRGGQNGFGGGFGRGGFGGGLVVTGVNGTTITATGRRNGTVTVQVTATTVYTEAGASASLSDVTSGETIAVRSANADRMATTTTITATGITIVLPHVVGVVSAVNGSTLTLTGFNGATQTVTVTPATRYEKAGQSATVSDISAGTAIAAEGVRGTDGSIAAKLVTIQLPRLAGQVTAVNGASITINGRQGSSDTITTSAATTYVNADGTAATASTIKTGSFIVGEGALSSNGKTLSAQRIIVGSFGRGEGGGRMPGFGRHGGNFDPSQGMTPSTGSTSTSGTNGGTF